MDLTFYKVFFLAMDVALRMEPYGCKYGHKSFIKSAPEQELKEQPFSSESFALTTRPLELLLLCLFNI